MNKIRPEELIKEMNIKEKYVIINQNKKLFGIKTVLS